MKGSMSRFSFICEICGKPRNRIRAEGQHDRCSKINVRRHTNG